MNLNITDREAEMLKAMLTSASILNAHMTTDPYREAYGPLLGKLLNQHKTQERRRRKNAFRENKE